MNTNIRGKRRNIQKTLESIQIAHSHHQNLHVLTQNSEPYCVPRESERKIAIPSGNDDKGMRMLRRYYRYKQNEEESDGTLNKYRSLELARQNLKRASEHKLNKNNSIQNSPYKILNQRKSAQRIAPEHQSAPKPALGKVISRDNKKFSIPKKVSIAKTKDPSLEKAEVWQLKEQSKGHIKLGQYEQALKLLEQIEEGTQTDIELLDLKGICLMNLKRFEEASIHFSRSVLLDQYYSKKVYISLALCENQLNHADRCLHYINQCIQIFPDYYEAFYFKGKLLYKQKLYNQAINMLLEASRLNPSKKEIKLLIAECYELSGDIEEAILYYQINATQINAKTLKYGIKYGSLLVQNSRSSEGIAILEKCQAAIDKAPDGFESSKLQVNFYLSLAYFRKKNYELCTMRGEEILNSSTNNEYTSQVIRIMITCKILEHNYYESIYFLRRLDYFQSNCQELRVYTLFSEAVMLLTKKKIEEGTVKLEQLGELLLHTIQDEFNVQIFRNYRLFLIYAYFLRGKYEECLSQIQQLKQIEVDPYFQRSINYSQSICQALIKYNHNEYFQAETQLKSCIISFPEKVETYLYLGLLHFKLYHLHQDNDKKEESKAAIYQNLTYCIQNLGALNSNYCSHIFYYRGLLYAWEGEWALSICDLDVAMEKSQDNFFNFYYLRAIVLANLQNYKQAISDVSIALSMNEEAAFGYLLRAKCLQIDGNPSQAFADLQAFIALRPQDNQIHKFAGHLLFQNGAFEDALQAYSQGEIKSTDFEVFLTRGKTYFLLGNFGKAAEDMLQASKMQQQSSQLQFDHRVMKWLGQLLHKFIKNHNEDCYEFDKDILAKNLEQLRTIYQNGSQSNIKYGKIFKLPEYMTLTALCNFYLEDYEKAIDNFIEVIELKQICLQSDDQGEFEEEEAEKLVFINQMYFNLALCCCMLQDFPNAERYLRKCQISPDLHNYEIYLELLDHIKGTAPVDENQTYTDLFSLRNKLSRYLPKARVPFLYKQKEILNFRALKLCIPYPKVEPPQINPSFDLKLIEEINLNQIERRADAPWIFREKNSIKFTDRIDVYSRFQMQKSEAQQQRKYQMGSRMSNSSAQLTQQINLKEQLKLDSKLEEKLKKLITKKK